MSDLMAANLSQFLSAMVPERLGLLKEIEKECKKDFIPLIEPEVGQFLSLQIRIKKAKRILEIGTAYGYSTFWLAQALGPSGGHITTLEINEARYHRACAYFSQAGLLTVIKPFLGDALDLIPTLKGQSFDFVFMDAAKGQYPEFFSLVWPLLEPGGVLVMDNIFLNGWVVDMTWPHRRKKTMVCRVRGLLEELKGHPELLTSLIPLGDGLAVCVRSESHEKS